VFCLSNDGDAGGKRRQAPDVIHVAMCQDHGCNRFRGDFGDMIQKRLSTGWRDCRIDHDHALISDDKTAVSDAAFDPVNG